MGNSTPAWSMRDVRLEDLTDGEFRDLVDREIRKDHPNTPKDEQARLNTLSPKLRHPAVINRWITVLEIMKASSETQISAKRSELKSKHGRIPDDEYLSRKRQFDSWRAGNVRFLNSVQQRLLEARNVRMNHFGVLNPIRLTEERNSASAALMNLVKAVESHRHTVLKEYDPTEADEALWAVIDPTLEESSVDNPPIFDGESRTSLAG